MVSDRAIWISVYQFFTPKGVYLIASFTSFNFLWHSLILRYNKAIHIKELKKRKEKKKNPKELYYYKLKPTDCFVLLIPEEEWIEWFS